MLGDFKQQKGADTEKNEDFDIKEKYSCMQKDASNVETAKWTLSINRFSYKSFFVEHSCCPEMGKKFAIFSTYNRGCCSDSLMDFTLETR